MSYREIAEEVTVLKLNCVAAAGCKLGQRFPLLNTDVSFTQCTWRENGAEADGMCCRY